MDPYPLENKPRNKCRKWQLRVSMGRDPATGRHPQRTKTFNGTYKEAERALREWEESAEAAPAGDGRQMLGDYLETFISNREASGDFAANTIAKYRRHQKVINMNLGAARMCDLTPAMIENAYANMRRGEDDRGRQTNPSGRPLSGTYTENVHRTLYTALKHAHDLGIIASNPCEKVDRPQLDTPEKRALRSVGIVALIGKLGDSCNEIALLLAVMTGMRRGEVMGLSWRDIDFPNRTINVLHAFDDHGNLKPTKGKRSRTIPVAKRVIDALEFRRAQQKREFEETRAEAESSLPVQTLDTPVFSDATGSRMMPHSLTRWWDRNRESYGFPAWTIHELRHSFLTEIAREGAPVKVLQELAGHANVSTTLDIYTHVDINDKRAAIDTFEGSMDRLEKHFGVQNEERFFQNSSRNDSEKETGQSA